MIRANKLYLLIFLFFIFTTYNSKEQNKSFSFIFPIKEIVIENTLALDLIKLKSDLDFFKNTSLFFLKKEKITEVINQHEFISSIQLKKKYPNTLKILVFEKIPVATQIIKKKKFYITKNDRKINYIELKIYEDLPIIFGNHKNFSFFFKDLEKYNFKINEIKAFYYFDIGRWDIILKDEKIIKLPEKNYKNILLKINSILDDVNFSKYKIFDYRIKDQLILQ